MVSSKGLSATSTTFGFDQFLEHFFAYIFTLHMAIVDVNKLFDHHPLHAARSYREDDSSLYISLRYRVF